MADDLMLKLALERNGLVPAVGPLAKRSPASSVRVESVKPSTYRGGPARVAPSGLVVAAARAERRSAFIGVVEAHIKAEDECLARSAQFAGMPVPTVGRLGQPIELAPLGPPVVVGDPDERVTVPVEGAPAHCPMVFSATRRELAELEHGPGVTFVDGPPARVDPSDRRVMRLEGDVDELARAFYPAGQVKAAVYGGGSNRKARRAGKKGKR